DGKRARGSESGARGGPPDEAERPGGDAAQERALSPRRPRARAERRPRRDQQGGGRLELPRPALARARGGPADPRRGHGLAPVAPDQALPPVRSAALLRVPPL